MAGTEVIGSAWGAGGALVDLARSRSLALFVALMWKSVLALGAGAEPSTGPWHGVHAKAPALRVAEAGWGNTDPQALRSVLQAVSEEFRSHFPGRDVGSIRIVPGALAPMVLYEKGERGEYVVRLSARDARWYQFVYQFAHELCHIYSNYDNKEWVDGQAVSRNQWFEESVCEAAALHTLNGMAARWESEPQAGWDRHAQTLRRYARMLRQQPHRDLPPDATLASWFGERRQALQGNPYLRREAEVVSNRLLELLEQTPDGWAAIGYLNAERGDASKSFEDYLAAWCRACPDRYRAFVENVIAIFGMTPPSVGLERRGSCATSPAPLALDRPGTIST